MKTSLRWSLRAALLTVTACDGLTFVEPAPASAALAIHLDVAIDDRSRYVLNALFREGIDDRGRPTEVVDRTLYVDGVGIAPAAETAPGVWSYRWQEERATTDDQRDSVRVAFPVVAGSPQAHSTTIPVSARDGPATVDVTRGDDLVLRVSLPDRAEVFGGFEYWTLEVRPSCSSNNSATQLRISGNGPFPTELRLPSQWLETLATGSTSACFQALASYPVVGSPYVTSVSVVARIAWQIRVIDP